MKETQMIKKFAVVLAAILCCNILGCGSREEGEKGTAATAAEDSGVNTEQKDEITIQGNRSSASVIPDPVWNTVDYSGYFQGVQGCAVVFDSKEDEYQVYNEDMCYTQYSPCSTFKIVSTLIGLETGILTGPDSTMGYDNTKYPVKAWNKDLTLKEAFQSSCIWYFRRVLDQAGADEVQRQLNELVYGNCDISQWEGSGVNPQPQLNGFWLESSLLISPMEQVNMMSDIMEGRSEYVSGETEILKELMLVQETDGHKIYGKTGSGNAGDGWFVGFQEYQGKYYYFAFYVRDENAGGDGDKAEEIGINVLTENQQTQ